jgi:hypothetical protein
MSKRLAALIAAAMLPARQFPGEGRKHDQFQFSDGTRQRRGPPRIASPMPCNPPFCTV